MAAELGMLSQTQLQKLSQQQRQQSAIWNYAARQPATDADDSWEVRAFAEDTGSAMGTTWPPRSYTCTFCRREFRSAQALGGHMNVHRRDRARLRQTPQVSADPSSSSAAASSPPVIFPSNEFVVSGGLCLFYPISNPAGPGFAPAADSPSTFLSISPYVQAVNFPTSSTNLGASLLAKVGMMRDDGDIGKEGNSDDGFVEELDLELRLGW